MIVMIDVKRQLRQLIPIITEQIASAGHDIGESYLVENEDGYTHRVNDYRTNTFNFEQDDWSISVEYRCCGIIDEDEGGMWSPPYRVFSRAWGNVTDLLATYEDPDTGQTYDLSNKQLRELREEIDCILSDLT